MIDQRAHTRGHEAALSKADVCVCGHRHQIRTDRFKDTSVQVLGDEISRKKRNPMAFPGKVPNRLTRV